MEYSLSNKNENLLPAEEDSLVGGYDGVYVALETSATPSTLTSRSALKVIGALTMVAAVAAIVVVLATNSTPKDSEEALGMDDWGKEVIANYTCGSTLVHPCDPRGGYCKKTSSWMGSSETCTCRSAWANRSTTCDWGPIGDEDTSEDKVEWTQERLKRVKLAYDASTLSYETFDEGFQWDLISGRWQLQAGNAYAAHENGNTTSAQWYRDCPSASETYGDTWAQYKFEDPYQLDATHVAVGRVQAAASPSGDEEAVISFGGTFSASKPFGQLEQVLTDTAITETALSWNGTDFGNVHGGFHSAVIPFVKPLLDLVQYSGMKKVMVTGHSLGAAEALVFGAILTAEQPDLDVSIYTFGCPRVGNPRFVKALADSGAEVLRFVNEIDFVSMIPTSIGLGDGVLHAGQQVTLNTAEVSAECKDFFVDNQYVALLTTPYSAYTGCLKESAMDHLSYNENVMQWLVDNGWSGAAPLPACSPWTL